MTHAHRACSRNTQIVFSLLSSLLPPQCLPRVFLSCHKKQIGLEAASQPASLDDANTQILVRRKHSRRRTAAAVVAQTSLRCLPKGETAAALRSFRCATTSSRKPALPCLARDQQHDRYSLGQQLFAFFLMMIVIVPRRASTALATATATAAVGAALLGSRPCHRRYSCNRPPRPSSFTIAALRTTTTRTASPTVCLAVCHSRHSQSHTSLLLLIPSHFPCLLPRKPAAAATATAATTKGNGLFAGG